MPFLIFMSQFNKNYFGSADPDAASLLHLNCLDTNEPCSSQAPKSPGGHAHLHANLLN